MKQFLIKIALFSALLLGVYVFFITRLAQGYVDMYYPKFEGQAGSLVLGISREHMAISPGLLSDVLKEHEFDGPIVNFAFEKTQSPYGEVYLEAIQKKLKPGLRNGLFVLGVTPGGFMVPKTLDEGDIREFDEETMKVANVMSVSSIPNYEYIFKFYGESLYKTFDSKREEKLFRRIHNNGWNEFRTELEHYTVTSGDIESWTSEGIKGAKYVGETERISPYRIEGLRHTIAYLKTKGVVLLVRCPVDKEFIELENGFWPDFNQEMQEIAGSMGVYYLNYARAEFTFPTMDGSHLVSEGARHFSGTLARDINKALKEPSNRLAFGRR